MKLGMDKSIFRRLLVSYMITVLLGLGAVGILMSFLTKGYIYEAKQEELLRKAKKVNLAIQNDVSMNENTAKMLMFLDQTFDTRIWVFDDEGKIIATSMKDEVYIGKSVGKTIVEKVLNGDNAVQELDFEGLEEPMISVAVSWGKEDNVYGGIVLHAPIVGLDKTIGQIRETIVWATLFGLLFTAAMVSYLSWSISRPLRNIDRVASEIGRGNYGERIQMDYADEIGDLATTINTMAEKLEKVDLERKKIDQIRDDFLANVSHELRTPLTAMQGFLEALQDGLIPEDARDKYYGVMYHETIHMNRMVDDIMDLVKLENQEITLAKYPIDITPLLNKVVFKFKQEAMERGNEIQVDIRDDLPKAYADSYRLEHIIDNLVKNAIKFTDNGRIVLEGEKVGNQIVIQVKDNGIGISDADQELIWERFFKVDRGRSKKNNGTGLGLAIVKELVELHDGKITVESQIEQGTTFRVWIPAWSSSDELTKR
jgi:signal transduction histidine kinase